MFWKASSFSNGSAVDGILDKQNFTLEELLDEDDLVQECKSLNPRLIAHLKQEAVLSKLLGFAINPSKSWATERQQQRFPFVACEVLCCEVDGIFDTLVHSSDLLEELFAFLDKDVLDKSRAGYFLRIIVSLLTKCSAPVMDYVHDHTWILHRALDHIENYSMLECLQNLLGAADHSPGNAPAADLQWLTSTNVLPEILQKLNMAEGSTARENAGKLLTHIGRSRNCPLTSLLPCPQNMQPMLERALEAQHGTQLKQALHVCIALLDRQHPEPAPGQGLRQSVERAAAAAAELDSQLEADTIEGVCQHAHRLAALLDVAPDTAELGTSYGVLQPPLGSSRLAVIALLDSLLSTGHEGAQQAVIDSDALPQCLQLMTQYPFNSILHHLVIGILIKALTAGPASLLAYLFQQCHLLQWILTLPTDVTPQQPADAPKVKRQMLRAGYMGHITQLANTLQYAAGDRAEVAEHVQGDEDWQRYLTSSLEPQNTKQDIGAWSFGRPEAKSSKRGVQDNDASQEEDVPLIMENGNAPDMNGHDRYASLEYDEEDHILFQQQQGVDDNVTLDSDEEDDSAANGNGLDHGDLTSFPVDSWEDTWDDGDAPASGQMGEGWGQMANQLYQHQWDTQEHSGWSDEEEHDPDLPLGQMRDADEEADDSVVLVDDEVDMDDGETVMVDALESLRLQQPHFSQFDRLSQLTQAAEVASDRPQTAKGGNRRTTPTAVFSHGFDADGVENDENISSDDTDEKSDQLHGLHTAARKQTDNPRSATGNSIWGLFGRAQGTSDAEQTSARSDAAHTDESQPRTEHEQSSTQDSEPASSHSDGAQSALLELHTQSEQRASYALPQATASADNAAHTSRGSMPAEANSTQSAASESSADAFKVDEDVPHARDSSHLQQDTSQQHNAVDCISEKVNSLHLHNSDREDHDSINKCQQASDSNQTRQQEELSQTHNQASLDKSDEENAFSGSQYWRTPLTVPDDIEAA